MSQIDSNPQLPSPYHPPSMAGAQVHGQYQPYSEGIDGRPPHPPHPQQPQPGAGAHPQPMQYYQPYPIPPPSDPNAPVRYPLPPHPEGRLMSGGRHKKEIKRRTKTGCLTCRKRRIKCDEGHPSCRNCQKSKRECLGYDPIFKTQPQPTAIQPASQPYSSMAHISTTPYTAPLPLVYTPASYGAPVLDGDDQQADKSTTIDPALDGSSEERNSQATEQQENSEQSGRERKRVKIEDVLCIGGVLPPPPAPPSSLSEEIKAEIRKIYVMAYASGMDKFFETRWFSERGLNQLMANTVLCDQFALLTHRFAMDPQDPAYAMQLQVTQSLEAMVVWSMLGLCRKVASEKDETGNVIADDVKAGVLDAAKRVEIFQALITYEHMTPESAPEEPENKPNGTALQGQLKTREYEFWNLVHSFLIPHDDSPESVQAVKDRLSTCRNLLESRENRDVIYSIMVARQFGPNMPGFPDKIKPPQTNDEKDTDAKLAVAKKLLEDEAGGRGTNQVVQRLCGAAVRSWRLQR